MNRQIILSALMFLLAVTSSRTLAAPAGGLAVLDLGKVATAMGWMSDMLLKKHRVCPPPDHNFIDLQTR